MLRERRARIVPRISIIVPVFNAERYLDACLDCLFPPDTQEIEVICADDGSCDRSLHITKPARLVRSTPEGFITAKCWSGVRPVMPVWRSAKRQYCHVLRC